VTRNFDKVYLKDYAFVFYLGLIAPITFWAIMKKTIRNNRNSFLIQLSIALFVLITQDSFASADHDESIVINEACGISGSLCSNKIFESKQIERFLTKVSRKNDDLNLKTLSGPPIILSNKKANQESRKVYWFLTYFQQIKYFLIQVRGWEGTSYLIINASTGDIHSLLGIPIFSEDLKRFAVASIDLEAGYIPNRIAIYQFFDNSIKREWYKDYTASGPSGIKWINNTVITFFDNYSRNGGQTIDKKLVTIRLLNGEWEIVGGSN
jgi:hypothetical protein